MKLVLLMFLKRFFIDAKCNGTTANWKCFKIEQAMDISRKLFLNDFVDKLIFAT